MGIPVVGGMLSGAVPWVVGKGGVLCDVRERTDILRAINHVLNPECYSSYFEAARARVQEKFTTNAVADGYLRIYQTANEANFNRCGHELLKT